MGQARHLEMASDLFCLCECWYLLSEMDLAIFINSSLPLESPLEAKGYGIPFTKKVK